MKYCTHCGAEIVDEAVICVHCGCSATNTKTNSDNDTLGLIAKVFMILGTIAMAICSCGISLAWCIPMTLSVSKSLENGTPIGTAMKVCTLIFVSQVAGILLLCRHED